MGNILQNSRFLIGYGGGALLALAAVLVGSGRAWWWLVAIGFTLLLLLFYFFVVSLWAIYHQYAVFEQRLEQMVWKLGRIRPEDRLVHIGLGERQLPLALGSHLTSGHLTIIDVYNPQLTTGVARQAPGRGAPDPRFTWLDGRIELLPLPDNSVPTITLCHTLSHFWQIGDCQQLLQEIYRILSPGGQLLLVEATRTQTNFLVLGWRGLNLFPAGHWQKLLQQSGLVIKAEAETLGLVHYFVAQKPAPQALHQLSFQFGQPASKEVRRF